ncbi:MAG: SDR family NAD(P)-dependent oxidoreductase [Microcystaceae cyanobacterium]
MNESNVLIIGASGGIGLAFVHQFLTRPTRIFATYRHPNQTLQDLQTQYRDRLVCLPLEITEETQIIQTLAQIKENVNNLHWVINCVGLLHGENFQPEKSLGYLQAEQLQQYFAVNSIAPVLLAKHLLPFFQHSERSIFATISAKVGSIGDNYLGGWYGYRASKAALNMLMRTTAIEYKRRAKSAIVVTLHPGTTDTELSKPFQRNVPPEKLFKSDRTARQLLTVLDNLGLEDSGKFFSWDGTVLPW